MDDAAAELSAIRQSVRSFVEKEVVPIADKLDNTRSMIRGYRIRGAEQWARTGKTAEDVGWYYGSLARRFRELRPGPLADELSRTFAELDRLLEAEPC